MELDIDDVTRVEFRKKTIPGVDGEREYLVLSIADKRGGVHHVRLTTGRWDRLQIDGAEALLRRRVCSNGSV